MNKTRTKNVSILDLVALMGPHAQLLAGEIDLEELGFDDHDLMVFMDAEDLGFDDTNDIGFDNIVPVYDALKHDQILNHCCGENVIPFFGHSVDAELDLATALDNVTLGVAA